MRLSLFAVATVLVLSGCNTWYQSTYEKIMVRTPGVDSAYCDLYTDNNRYAVITSRLVVVERSNLPLTVVCEKTGYYTASVIVKAEVYANPATLNLFNGVVPGMAYDIADNSIYNYPDTIIVTLLPMPPQKLPPEPAPYELQKKPEEIKPAPPASAPSAADADQSMSKSLRK